MDKGGSKLAEIKHSEAINNRFYWGKIGVPAKILLVGCLMALAGVTTFLVKFLILKIILFFALVFGLVYAVLVPLVILPKRRAENLQILKDELGGKLHEPELRSRGFSSYVIWAGDYKGYPVEIEETFEGPTKKGIYNNVYRVKMELHKQFEMRRARSSHIDLNDPNYTNIMGIKFILNSRNNKELLTQWFFEDDRRLARLVTFFEFVGDADIQGRWISIGVRTDNVTPVRRDYNPRFVKEIFDYMIELGEALRDAKVIKSRSDGIGMPGMGMK